MTDYDLSLTGSDIDAALVAVDHKMQYICDPSEGDQGAAGNGYSLKDFIDTIGTSKSATLYLLHHPASGNTTAYTLTTSETIPSNISIYIDYGVILDGGGTLTINGGFKAGLYKVFGSSITVEFYEGQVSEVYPQWWGAVGDGSTDDQVAIQAALDASKGRICRLPPTYTDSYLVGAPLTIDSGNRLLGSGSSETNGTTIKLDDNVSDNVIESANWTAQSGWIHWFEIGWLVVNGNKSNNASTSCGIAIYGMGETAEIHNVQIEDVNDYGLRLSGVGAPNRIRNVKIQDSGVAAVYDDQTGGAVTTYDQLSGDDNQIFYKFEGRANRLLLHTKAEGLHDPYCDIQLTDPSGAYWPITDIGSNVDGTGETVADLFRIENVSGTASITLVNFRQANYTNLFNDIDTGEAYTVAVGGAGWLQDGIRTYNGKHRLYGTGSSMFLPFNVPFNSEASLNSGTDVEILKQTGSGLRLQDATGGGIKFRETGMSAAETLIRHKTSEITCNGATETWVGALSGGTITLGVSARVTQVITGATSIDVGISGVDADIFIDGMAVALNTTADIANSNAAFTSPIVNQGAKDILVTGIGGAFTGGTLRLVVHYIDLTAATS